MMTESLFVAMRNMALALVLAMVFTSNAMAQKYGNGTNAPSAAIGGGTTGASNRGGAGGISNTDPGGGPMTVGDPATSAGPTSTETSRSGYMGGRNTDPVVPPITPPSTTIVTLTETRFGKCPTSGGMRTHQSRISGNNLGRIEAVSHYLRQAPENERPGSSDIYLLADLQEELQKPQPDVTLVGTYLGIVAKSTITPSLAADVGQSLCAAVSPEVAERIAEIAETQRQKLAQPR